MTTKFAFNLPLSKEEEREEIQSAALRKDNK
jgi:hypothetical protein